MKKVILSLIVFFLSFFLTSPFSFVRLGFLWGIFYESGDVLNKVHVPGMTVFTILMRNYSIDYVIIVLFTISFILTLYHRIRNGWRKLLDPKVVILAWIVLYACFLIFKVSLLYSRYVLPLIPFVIIFSTYPISEAVKYITNKFSKKYAVILTTVLIIMFISYEIPKSFEKNTNYRKTKSKERIIFYLQEKKLDNDKLREELNDYFSKKPLKFLSLNLK